MFLGKNFRLNKNSIKNYFRTSKIDILIRIFDIVNFITFLIVAIICIINAYNLISNIIELILTCWIPIYLTVLPFINMCQNRAGKIPIIYFFSFIAQGILNLIIPFSALLILLCLMNIIIFFLKIKNIKYYWKSNISTIIVISIIIIILILQLSAIIPLNGLVLFSFTLKARNNNTQISFFVEWYYTEDDVKYMFSDEALDLLNEYNSTIYLLIPESNLTAGSYAENVTKLLNNKGISVWAWLATKEEHGYYYTDETHQYFPDLIQKVHSWANERNLTFEGMMLDIEPNTFHRNKQTELINKGDYIGALMDFRSQFNNDAHSESEKTTKELIDNIHSLGYKAAYCGPDLFLEDSQDNDDDLIQLFGLPHPVKGFDKYIMMLYRSLYPWTEKLNYNYYLYRTSKNYLKKYSDSFCGALATLGKGAYGDSHPNNEGLELLRSDIMILRNLGVKEIPLWCLEWLLWYRWDTYIEDLRYILLSGTTQPKDSLITINPTYFTFRSALYTIDILMDLKI
ncbi:MAG: hypothetical protein ACP6IY_12075 [Promethearchaeia archaeon]